VRLYSFVLVFFSFLPVLSFSQKHKIPTQTIQSFEGVWKAQHKGYSNTEKIKFEKNKPFATLTDIGTGEAPPIILHAFVQGNELIIPAKENSNDEIRMKIKNKKLLLKRITIRTINNPKTKQVIFRELFTNLNGK
jgi:hypothetical protein